MFQRAFFIVAASALLAVALGVNLHDLAQKEVTSRCPYPGYTTSKYCPKFTGIISAFEEGEISDRVERLKGVVGVGVDLPSGKIVLPVLAQTYNHGVTWQSATTKTTYRVPDGWKVTQGYPRTERRDIHLFHLLQDYANFWADQWAADKVNEGGSKTGGLFSETLSASDLLTDLFIGEHNQAAIVVLDRIVAYSLSLNSSVNPTHMPLDPVFLAALDYLPAVYDANLYQELVVYWGTHVAVSGEFGGNIQEKTVLRECLYSVSGGTMTDSEMRAQAALDYLQFLDPHAPGPNNAKYKAARKIVQKIIDGGNPELSDLNQRIASFEADPVLTKFDYVPLWKFVRNSTIATNVRRAITDHLSAVRTTQERALATSLKQARANFLAPKPITVAMNVTFYLGSHIPEHFCHFATSVVQLNLAAGQSQFVPHAQLSNFWQLDIVASRTADGLVMTDTPWHNKHCTQKVMPSPVACGCAVVNIYCDGKTSGTVYSVEACQGCDLHIHKYDKPNSPFCNYNAKHHLLCSTASCDCPPY
eukprot:GCRY01000914.1.p1 GENE.GCRY01000914.1~~GCRY01000914.1.p1  ORF type:complete len:531 (+),score=87.23 GCRY01000914.1:171-1763(+)